jgi:hypothetical protein
MEKGRIMTPRTASGGLIIGILPALVVTLSACSADTTADGSSSESRSVDQTISPTPQETPSDDSSDAPTFGPDSVRVISMKRNSTELSFILVGSKGALYELREATGKRAECRQVEQGALAVAPPGLPVGSNWQTELICVSREQITKTSRVLVKVKFKSFTYDFEIPATPSK